jgi:hypothetical protein
MAVRKSPFQSKQAIQDVLDSEEAPKSSNGRRRKAQAQDIAAGSSATTVLQQPFRPSANIERREHNMSELPTIVEYSEDIASAEAPAPIPVGEYPAEIRGVEIKTSQKGNRFYAVKFFIAPENYPVDFTEGDPDGMTLTYNRVLAEDNAQARFRVRKFCEAIGAKMGKRIDVNDWIGLSATIAIKHDEFEGEPRAQIDRVVGTA